MIASSYKWYLVPCLILIYPSWQEREDRERNVFNVKPTARKGADGSTVVEPFNLSEGVNK